MAFGITRSLTALALSMAALPADAAAASDSQWNASTAAFAKQEAILGTASRLSLVAARQGGGEIAPVQLAAGVAPAAGRPFAMSVSPAVALQRMRRAAAADRPDVFGSTALKITHTPLDRQWRRTRTAAVPAGSWAGRLGAIGGLDSHRKLELVNSWVNTHIKFADDRQIYGSTDHWAGLSEAIRRGRGDCEDYAIAKRQLLRAIGFADNDLYLTIVRDLVRRADHAVLVVRVDDQFLVLDNGTNRIVDAQDIADYRPVFSFTATGAWLHGYRRELQFASAATAPVPSTR